MSRYRKIDPHIWNDVKFRELWEGKWDTKCRVPKQAPYPYSPLPAREAICLYRRRQYKKLKEALLRDAIARLGAVCIHCGAVGTLLGDHVIPIAWGGTNDAINIQPSCMPCNRQRGASLPVVGGDHA